VPLQRSVAQAAQLHLPVVERTLEAAQVGHGEWVERDPAPVRQRCSGSAAGARLGRARGLDNAAAHL
jgi:hypothetical protein